MMVRQHGCSRISYTRVHQAQVRGLVWFLRASRTKKAEQVVFWDEDLEPGEEWFDQFTAAIDRSRKLFVFWCSHAATSAQVRREFTYMPWNETKRLFRCCSYNTPLDPAIAGNREWIYVS